MTTIAHHHQRFGSLPEFFKLPFSSGRKSMTDLVTPIEIAGYGRSGTTAVMALLGTTPQVAFDRVYPFENRYLTYLAKFALLAGRAESLPSFGGVELYEYSDNHFGPMPWPRLAAEDGRPPLTTSSPEWMSALWRTCSETIRRLQPAATHYAEKVPVWLPAITKGLFPRRVLHLVRDPRDVFLSARDFARKRATVGFGMDESSSDMEQARHTAHGLLTFAENERAERDQGDALRIRYEDWMEQPAAFVDRLNGFLGIKLTPESNVTRHLGQHMTSANPAASVGRWRREPLPPAVQSFLEAQLYHRMTDYGYELPEGACPAAEIVPDSEMRCSGDGKLTAGASGATVKVWGQDFWVELPPAPIAAADFAEFWACVRGASGDHCSLYWRGHGESFAQERCISVPYRPGPHWQILRFRTEQHALWQGRIEQIRVDFFNGAVTPGAEGEVRWLRYIT